MLAICAADAANRPNAASEHNMITLTVNEIRRMINSLIIQPIRNLAHRLHWSGWRRRHQARARNSHYKRRLNPQPQP